MSGPVLLHDVKSVFLICQVYDLLHEDMQAFYQAIFPLARVILVELQDHILSTYDREISDYTSELFARYPPAFLAVYQPQVIQSRSSGAFPGPHTA